MKCGTFNNDSQRDRKVLVAVGFSDFVSIFWFLPRLRFVIRNGFFVSAQAGLPGQTDLRHCVPFLINRDNVI